MKPYAAEELNKSNYNNSVLFLENNLEEVGESFPAVEKSI
jgi:hypothetical protein